MKFIKAYKRNPGTGEPIKEEMLANIDFNIHKFNNRIKPTDKKQILIITNFSEFGCETIGSTYCIPEIIKQCPGAYVICVGWYGRKFLYKHLVDEFWELKEEYQWLREFTQAFRPTSKNIKKLERELKKYGRVYNSFYMGHICLGNKCLNCKFIWRDEKIKCCEKCQSTDILPSLFADKDVKSRMVPVPKSSSLMLERAKFYLKPNSVGIFARNRVCYGRNLSAGFYVKVINFLESLGYNPVWLGEKQSVLPCPVSHIVDFSRDEESKNLELTLAIISQLQFTVQFYTASTRLASIVGVPWLLVESRDQIYGRGQEGKRILLTTDFDKKKIIIAHYFDVLNDEEWALGLIGRGINEMKANNWKDIS